MGLGPSEGGAKDGTDEGQTISHLKALGASSSAHADLGLLLPGEQVYRGEKRTPAAALGFSKLQKPRRGCLPARSPFAGPNVSKGDVHCSKIQLQMEKKVETGIFAFISPLRRGPGRQRIGVLSRVVACASSSISDHHEVIPPAQGWPNPWAWAQRGTAMAGDVAGRGSALASLLK